MDAETQSKWNEWCDARALAIVRDYVDQVIEVIGAETGREDGKLLKQIVKLRAQLTLLRGQMTVMRVKLNDITASPTRKGSARHSRG